LTIEVVLRPGGAGSGDMDGEVDVGRLHPRETGIALVQASTEQRGVLHACRNLASEVFDRRNGTFEDHDRAGVPDNVIALEVEDRLIFLGQRYRIHHMQIFGIVSIVVDRGYPPGKFRTPQAKSRGFVAIGPFDAETNLFVACPQACHYHRRRRQDRSLPPPPIAE
jgi:hypothetical protein